MNDTTGYEAMEFLKTIPEFDEIWQFHDDADYNETQLTKFAERYHEHKMKAMELKTTDRQIGHFREQLSRIIRQVKLIEQGKSATVKGKKRLDIIVDCATDIDDQLKELK